MSFVIVQVSPKRWVVAEQQGIDSVFYKIITKPIAFRDKVLVVWQEILDLDMKDYSALTKEALLD